MSVRLPKPIDAYVGSRVRMRRLMLGMSQSGSPPIERDPSQLGFRNMRRARTTLGEPSCRLSPSMKATHPDAGADIGVDRVWQSNTQCALSSCKNGAAICPVPKGKGKHHVPIFRACV